jgi:hypothetical protein
MAWKKRMPYLICDISSLSKYAKMNVEESEALELKGMYQLLIYIHVNL